MFYIGDKVYESASDVNREYLNELYAQQQIEEAQIDLNPTPTKGVVRRVTDVTSVQSVIPLKEVNYRWVNKTGKAINLLSKAGILTHLPPVPLLPNDSDKDKLVLITSYRVAFDNAATEYRQYVRTRSKRTFTSLELQYYDALKNIVNLEPGRAVSPVITLTFTTEYEINQLDLSNRGSYLVEADVIAIEENQSLPLHPVSDERTTAVSDTTILHEKSMVIAIDLIDNEHALPAQYFLFNDEMQVCKPRSHERLPSNAYVTVYTPTIDPRSRLLQREDNGKLLYDRKTFTVPLSDISSKLRLYSTQQEAKTGGNNSAAFQIELEKLKQENMREQVLYSREKQRASMELEMLQESITRTKHEASLKELHLQTEINDLKHQRDKYKLDAEREKFIREQDADKRKYFMDEKFQEELREAQRKASDSERELQQWKTYAAWAGVAATLIGLGVKVYSAKK